MLVMEMSDSSSSEHDATGKGFVVVVVVVAVNVGASSSRPSTSMSASSVSKVSSCIRRRALDLLEHGSVVEEGCDCEGGSGLLSTGGEAVAVVVDNDVVVLGAVE